MTRAVVIGGGPVGLSTAVLLAHGGLEVTLLERHSALGGRSAPVTLRTHALDPSPWFLFPEAYEEFFSLVGRRLDDYLDFLELDMRFRVFFEKGLDIPAEVLDLDVEAQTNWDRLEKLSPGDGEASRRLVLKAGQRHHLIQERLARTPYLGPSSFLHPSGAHRLPWVIGILGRHYGREITGAIRDLRIRRIFEFPALALTGSPLTTSAGYSSSYFHHLGGSARYPRGGSGSVIAALERIAREEGVDLRTDSDVARILVDPQSRLTSGVVLRTGDVVPADLVVSCVDPHHTETSLLTDAFRSFSSGSWTRFQASPSMLLAVFGVKKKLPELAHHNLFFPQNWDRILAELGGTSVDDPFCSEFIYVGKPTATDPSLAPKGKESMMLIVPLPADASCGATPESRQALHEMVSRLLNQVGTMADIPDLAKRIQPGDVFTPSDFAEKYSAWKGSGFGLAPTLRGLIRPRPGNLSRRVRNLLYPGSSMLPYPGFPGAFDSAVVTAKTLLGRTGNETPHALVEPGFLHSSSRRDTLGSLLRQAAVED